MKITISQLKKIIKKQINERLLSAEERMKFQAGKKTPKYENYISFLDRNQNRLPISIIYSDIINFLKIPGNLYSFYKTSKKIVQDFVDELNNTSLMNEIDQKIINARKITIQELEVFIDRFLSEENIRINIFELIYVILNINSRNFKNILDVAKEAYENFDQNGNLPEPENLDNYEYNISTEEKFKERYADISDRVNKSFLDIDIPLGDFALNIIQNDNSIYGGNSIMFFAINPILAKNAIIELFEKEKEKGNILIKNILYDKIKKSDPKLNMYFGVIGLDKLKDPDCYGSYQTSFAAAQLGYGPKMYSIAASWVKRNGGNYNKITSDRISVRPAARKVWEKTFKDRINDFDVYELDDFKLPQEERRTPDDPWDDCILQNKQPDMDTNFYLNHAYEIKRPLNYGNFQTKYNMFIKVMSRLIKSLYLSYVNIQDIEEDLNTFFKTNAGVFFDREYNK